MHSLDARRRTFDEVAEAYDRFRPGYPEQLVDDVLSLSGMPPRGRMLEIGGGTGKATVSFARRGFEIVVIEPGPHLAELAARNLAGFPGVRIEVCAFERWPLAAGTFDLVVAAQSFHFLDAPTTLDRIADALRRRGGLAVFANHPRRGVSALDQEIQRAYERHAPELTDWSSDAPDAFEDRIDASGRFETVWMARYPWRHVYAAADYVGFIGTHSDHRLLEPDRREALLREVGEAIAAHGGALAIEFVTTLHFARKRAAG